MKFDLTNFLFKYEKFIPIALFLIFLAVTLPGISWGAPSLWNPDELFWRVNMALGGEMKFDETEPDYNYPSLPKHIMYGVAWLVKQAGGSPTDILVSARLISVLLGGLVVILIYQMTKMASANIYIRLLAAFLALSNTALAHNARFAHNDLYLLFFITLSLFALLKYRLSAHRLWMYLAFFAAGCAASSKYTGASFLAVLLIFFLIENRRSIRTDFLRALETFFISVVLTVAGYVIGTPKSLLWMSFYFKRMIPAALRFASYGRSPDSEIGFFGQWGTFRAAVGTWVYYLFLVAFAWFVIKLVLGALNKESKVSRLWHQRRVPQGDDTCTALRTVQRRCKTLDSYFHISVQSPRRKIIFTLLASIFIFDLPFWMSYNYVPRFFLPFLPMFAVLASLFVEDVAAFAQQRNYAFAVPVLSIVVIGMIVASFLQVVSVALLFANDARTQAGEFIETLEPDTVLEYTLYPPSIPENHFSKARNYQIYLIKYPGETVPTNKAFPYNRGEDGLYDRGADYLIVDSFTYERFSDSFICETNPVECEFFNKLIAGQTSLQLLASFEYDLPPYLPQISLAAVNPDIKIYAIPR